MMIDASTVDTRGTDRSWVSSSPNVDRSVTIARKVKTLMKDRENQEYPEHLEASGYEEPWTDQHEEAMLYVLEGLPVTEAAHNVAVTRRTVHRWMLHPRFQAALKERDQRMALELQIEMTSIVQESFDSLNQTLRKDDYTA